MKCALMVLLMVSTAQAASLKSLIKPVTKLSTLTILSAEFDAGTTYYAISSGRGYEANSLMRPFGRSALIFPVLGASAVGVDYFASWIEKNNHKKLAKTVRIICIGSHVMAGVSNLHQIQLSNQVR